ncbi:Rab family GTPase [Legionella longbeachae]|uniref:Putative Ras family GTPase n=1 Tax=Legionella longbeachae serogroup 1 (strain NSW150) TaxID=661367 RepID=D3HMQ2_LEGLN|nr:Rab family GTPase [Legionella longbeachae]VEE04253.1 Ras family GTPase [Legionella oakridgensis]HBD7397023.1 GTP-binding protein [Legionella pneumophila]ARB92919.1 GTP-binding protein [Legionella longbeachae]ARM33940.1 GTP-binding protein [Legionella longbeachae]EEZ96855.1 Ras family small GTP-binding protein domain-containing protein [Legionella longbeachae D-4968]
MEHKEEYDEHLKIILLGDNYVGKSCLLASLCGNADFNNYFDTMGVDQKIKFLGIYNKTIKLRIWDASGAPGLQKIVTSYFHHADGAFICFDLTNLRSFYNAKVLIERFRASNKEAPIILVGCKSDLIELRNVSCKEANELANHFGLTYIETSARKEINVKEGFKLLSRQIYFLAQIKKIKPILEGQYHNYLLSMQKNRSSLFSACSQYPKENLLSEEYHHSLEQFLKATDPSALNVFCIKILDLIERADQLYEQENPYWSILSHSPLSKILRHALNFLCSMPSAIIELSDIRELISKDRFFCKTTR